MAEEGAMTAKDSLRGQLLSQLYFLEANLQQERLTRAFRARLDELFAVAQALRRELKK